MPSVDRDHWRRATAVAVATLVASGCAHLPPKSPLPAVGTFLDASGHVIDDATVRGRIGAARFVLVGEAHDNACDHAQERRIAEIATGAGPLAIGLEMVTYDRQPILDDYGAGRTCLAGLASALDWKAMWGFPFDSYSPIFEVARSSRSPVIGLNASERIVHTVRDIGLNALTSSERMEITPTIIRPPHQQEAMLKQAMDEHRKSGHSSGDADAAWSRFITVQSFWDTQMAWRAARAAQSLDRRVLIFAGGGHVEHGWGIAWRLRSFAPGARVLALTAWRGGDFDPSEADLFFYCPDTSP
jgi:uncharacterized iron-regulated protein